MYQQLKNNLSKLKQELNKCRNKLEGECKGVCDIDEGVLRELGSATSNKGSIISRMIFLPLFYIYVWESFQYGENFKKPSIAFPLITIVLINSMPQ